MIDGPFFVTYYFKGKPTRSATPDHEPWPLGDITNGFWITESHQMCRASQGQYWIPPSMIMMVEKRNQSPNPL